MVVRRVYGRMGRHADDAIQSRRFRRGHGRSDFRVRNGTRSRVRLVVLGRALRKAGRIPEPLAVCVYEECENAYADFAGRSGHDGSDRAEPGAVSRAEALWRPLGLRRLSAGAARIAGGETSRGYAEKNGRVVPKVLE